MRYLYRLTIMSLLILVIALQFGSVSYGAIPDFFNRSDQLSTSAAGATARNVISFTITDTSSPVGSLEFQFCVDSPLPLASCAPPTGLNASGVILASQSGNTGFSVASNSTANAVILTRSPSNPTSVLNTYELDNIVNPAAAETYYLRIYMYSSTDASGGYLQYGGVALSTTSALTVSTIVPPYLKFCAAIAITQFNCATSSGYIVNLGNLSASKPSFGTAQFTTATNAQNGFSVTVTGTTMTSGNNIIPNLSTPTPSLIGSSQFGINLRNNSVLGFGADPVGPGVGQITTNYNQPNLYTYNNGDVVVTASTPSDNQTFTVSYLVNVDKIQPPGQYATTITYVCLANF